MRPHVADLYRYPVKGLSPERLAAVMLEPGKPLPFDRAYAIENGPSGFDPAAASYLPKIRFLMLMRNERLAQLSTRFDDATHTLTITQGGEERCRGDLRTAAGRAAVEAFFASYSGAELRGPPKVLHAEGHSFSDVAAKVVSIVNLASVAALENVAGGPLDPRRFRANLYVSGWPAWSEFDLLGSELTVGSARLRVRKRIKRCAAIDVDPRTGIREPGLPQALVRHFGHSDCGVYAEVVVAGRVECGDAIEQKKSRRAEHRTAAFDDSKA